MLRSSTGRRNAVTLLLCKTALPLNVFLCSTVDYADSHVEEDDKADMSKSFPALKAELCSVFGEEGPLPKLSHLQRLERRDLEQASVLKTPKSKI